ncbi:MAG TPA: hypothetical protein VK395_02095 [Gemmataceae bacterium]|nr:hypothetical protein [Gemmataceae bacterium]
MHTQQPREADAATLGPTGLTAHLRSLSLCHVSVADFPTPRAAEWLRGAAAAGWPLPLGLAHDLGLLLSVPAGRVQLRRPAYLPIHAEATAYLAFLQRLMDFPLVRELPAWRPVLTDAVIAVLLARLVEGLDLPDAYRLPPGAATRPFISSLGAAVEEVVPAQLWTATPPAERQEHLLWDTAMDRIQRNLRALDRDELGFLVHYGTCLVSAPDPRDLLDLLALTGLPAAAVLAQRASLRLLPCVSDPRTTGGLQSYPEGGYEGIARTGSLDSLLPSEAIYPDEIFLHRLVNGEALYYGRECLRERQRQLAYVIMQTGWGLGGDGQVLARALLLALGQAMSRRGYDLFYSFAGSELDEPRTFDKPGEVGRILYHTETAPVNPGKILSTVLHRLKQWRPAYRGRQVLWVLDEYFDAEEADAHRPLYTALGAEAGQRAWYVRVGESQGQTVVGNPPTAGYFENWKVLETRLLWAGHRNEPV